MLSRLSSYRDEWTSAIRRRCLDLCACVGIQLVALHLYLRLQAKQQQQHIDGLDASSCCSSSDSPQLLQLLAPAAGAAAQHNYPRTTLSSFVQTAVAVMHPMKSFLALAKDTLPAGRSPIESESVLLVLYSCALLIAAGIILAPASSQRWRSHMFIAANILANSAALSSLITHPHSAPSQHWTTYLPNAGIGMVWQQIMFRVRETRICV